MDQFVNLAKQFAGGNNNNEQQHQQQGQNFGNQGGPQFNAPHGSGGSSGGFGDILSMFNQGSAVSGAQQELGHQTDPQTQSILAQGFAQTQAYGSNAVQQGGAVDLNEDGIIDDYERAYSRGEAQKGQMSSESMGTAAAMSAFKKFMGGNDAQKAQSSGGGDMQSKLIGMAMAEAMKLFSSSGGQTTNGGGQQDVVNAAGKQIMKMMLKSQMSGSTGTGGGAMGGLMSMASKFM